VPIAIARTGIEFLKNNRAEPHNVARIQAPYGKNPFIGTPQSRYVDGSVEQSGLHYSSSFP
jgi:hypothetical protein